MIAPAPNVFSIWLIVLFSAFSPADTAAGFASVDPCRLATALPPKTSASICTQGHYSNAQELSMSSCQSGFSPRQRGPGQGGVDRPLAGERRGEGDGLGDGERAGRPGPVVRQEAAQLRRGSTPPLHPAEGHV